jgi:hypothetical protein
MFESFYDIIDYLFPIYIIRRDDVLSIEDRRPTVDMLLSAAGAVILIWLSAQTIYWAFSEESVFKFLILAIAAAGYLIYRALTRTFREIYVFDKTKDTYWFTRQSVLKKEVIQGAASQFRAAEVIRQISYDDSGYETYTYRAALLQQPGLLLGTDETQVLRENPPIYNSYMAEAKIAGAISSFLNITNHHEVDTLQP